MHKRERELRRATHRLENFREAHQVIACFITLIAC